MRSDIDARITSLRIAARLLADDDRPEALAETRVACSSASRRAAAFIEFACQDGS
jgi:hypothetical protein